MAALESGLLLKTSNVPQCKAFLFFLTLVPVLMLVFLHLETIMLIISHASTAIFEAPGLAFFLVNCLVVIIFASTKLESDEKGRRETEDIEGESIRECMEKGDEKGEYFSSKGFIRRSILIGQSYGSFIAKGGHEEESERESMRKMEDGGEKGAFTANHVSRIGQSYGSSKARGYNYHMNEEEDFVGRVSLNASTHGKHIKPINVSEREPIMRDCSVDEKRPFRRAYSVQYGEEKPVIRAYRQPLARRPSANARAPPTAVAAAPRLLARAAHTAAVAVGNPSKEVKEDTAAVEVLTDPSQEEVKAPSDGPTAAIDRHEAGDADEDDRELEELNRRAEEFIARFNHQMRLQRQESLQRKARRTHRPCNQHIHHSKHLEVTAPGVMVGT